MKRVILADEKYPLELHPEVVVTYGALTAKQYRQAEAIKQAYYADKMGRMKQGKEVYLAGCIDYFDFVCRHGIRSITGLLLEEQGSTYPLKVAREVGLYGEALTEENWDEIYPFLSGEIPSITQGILQRSQIESSAPPA